MPRGGLGIVCGSGSDGRGEGRIGVGSCSAIGEVAAGFARDGRVGACDKNHIFSSIWGNKNRIFRIRLRSGLIK